MQRVLIIDYGMGNLKSVYGAVKHFGIEPKVSDLPEEIQNADKIIIPGVGAFGKAVENMKRKNLFYHLKEEIEKGKKIFLGICLGLQILFPESEESEGVEGLGVVKGKVLNLKKISENVRVPNIGWVETEMKTESPIFYGLSQREYFYYIHSYFVLPEENYVITAELISGDIRFPSAIQKGNVFGTQFHPEKSGEKGLKIIENFLKL